MNKRNNSFYSLLDTQERLEKSDNIRKDCYQHKPSYLDLIDTQTKQLIFCYVLPIISLLTYMYIKGPF